MKYLLISCLLISSINVIADNGFFKGGAAAAAMGNTALTQHDVWSMFHNPAGLAFITNTEAGVSYEKRFNLKELSTNTLAFAVPFKNTGTIGVDIGYFGFSNFNEQTAGFAYAKNFGKKFSAGVKLNYLSYSIAEDYGKKSFITGEVGIQAEIVSDLWLGAHIYNPVQQKITDNPSEKLPSVFSFGASYIFSEKLTIEIASEKATDEKARFRGGIAYHPMKQLYLRAGTSSQPFASSFGFGLLLNNLKIDFAALFHPDLGFTPNISLGYTFAGK
jgi:hypothetical protein